jgi:hypothetical protein
MIQLPPFTEIAAILTLATVLGVAGQKLLQPLIMMFLTTTAERSNSPMTEEIACRSN